MTIGPSDTADHAGLPLAGSYLSNEKNEPSLSDKAADNDIAVALKLRLLNQLTTENRMYFTQRCLKVSADYPFPYSVSGKRKYYVSVKHISGQYNCFYFSPSLKGLLCLPCVLFVPDKVGYGSSQAAGNLITKPLTNFSKLTGSDSYLSTHLTRSYHEDADLMLKEFSNAMMTSAGEIAAKLNATIAKKRENNRAILYAVLHEIETCGRMNLALRGHRDNGPIKTDVDREHIDYTQGNLRCLIQKAAVHYEVLKDHLQNGPKNATYLSPEIQNDLIISIGKVMLNKICAEVSEAKYFAISADETTDVHKSHQMVVTLRYVDKDNEICESFASFIEVEEASGKAITDKLLQFVESNGLDKNFIVAMMVHQQ